MFRFYYTIVMRIGSIIHFVPKMRKYARHPEKYSEEDCHELCKVMIAKVAKTARATTSYYGLENLPADGGYIMYANHQGKYDALGIMWGHPRPCRVLMNLQRSRMPIANEYVSLVRGKRIDSRDLRQQVRCINEIGEEVRAGSVYLIFPEGGYRKHQDNYMNRFRSGCIRSAMISERPIVPVALIDSFKPFGIKGLDLNIRIVGDEAQCQIYLSILYQKKRCTIGSQSLGIGIYDLIRERVHKKFFGRIPVESLVQHLVDLRTSR